MHQRPISCLTATTAAATVLFGSVCWAQPSASLGIEVAPGPNQAVVEQAVEALRESLLACFESVLSEAPAASFQVTMRIDVDASGRVREAEFEQADPYDGSAVRCLSKELEGMVVANETGRRWSVLVLLKRADGAAALGPGVAALVASGLPLRFEDEPLEIKRDASKSFVIGSQRPLRAHDPLTLGRGSVYAKRDPRATPATAMPLDVRRDTDKDPYADETIINHILSGGFGPMFECFRPALIDDPALSGRIELRLTLGEGGGLVASNVRSSTLNNPVLESCILSELLSGARFPKHVARAMTFVGYAMSFEGTGEPIESNAGSADQSASDNVSSSEPEAASEPTREAELPPPGTPVKLGAESKARIDRAIRRHLTTIQHCYEQELLRNPDTREGRVIVRFTIAPSGSAHDISIKSTELHNASVESCIVEVFSNDITFERPSGGGRIVVSFPFTFRRAR